MSERARANLLTNGNFATLRTPAPDPTVRSVEGGTRGGPSVAAGWSVWNNAVPATTTTRVVSGYVNPPGAEQVLHVVTSGASCGVVAAFDAANRGPQRVASSAWVKVIRGQVCLGTGNGGNTKADVLSAPHDRWQQLRADNGVSPANQLIVYSTMPDTEFYVSAVAVYEPVPASPERAPLIDLDPDGSPASISYNVPEPTSYSGRHYIEIVRPPEAFLQVQGSPATPAQQERLEGVLATSTVDTVAVGQSDGPSESAIVATQGARATDRLSGLTVADVQALAAQGKRVVVQRGVGDVLDYQVVEAPKAALAATAGLTAALTATPPRLANGGPEPHDPGESKAWRPTLDVFVDSPQANSPTPVHGTAAGCVVRVTGRWSMTHAGGSPTVTVAVDGGQAVTASVERGAFSADVAIAKAGLREITVTATKSAQDSAGRAVNLRSVATTNVTVELDAENPAPPPVPPTVAISKPRDGTLLLSEQGSVKVTVSGTAVAGPRASIGEIAIEENHTRYSTVPDAKGAWALELVLSGIGRHTLTVAARDDRGLQSPAATRTFTVSDEQPFRRLVNRLLIVETLTLSSFLGKFGAGRVIKTFSLLPGESTTLSVKSYSKSTAERKAASCIVDSNATDSTQDFTDSLAREQSNSEALTETSNYKVGAEASAAWGWGSASISGEYSGTANAARQEAVKNVANATRHHASKASTNRSVTINTEYQVHEESGVEESSTRTISNVNVSRTLNFVFRQMNQEHVTLVHLTNVRVARYAEDLMLEPDGTPAYKKKADGTDYVDPTTNRKVLDIRPTYREVPLPELDSLLAETITTDYQQSVRESIMNALSGIPDYQDRLQTAYEWVTPTTESGTPVPEARYMQFPRNLRTIYVEPGTGTTFVVPGIVLHDDRITLRTEGVMVDAMLGPGNGLDEYSRRLQQVTLAEREVAVAERQARLDREHLARTIVTDKDDVGAAVFAKVFAPQPIVQAAPSSNGVSLKP